jgi:hypothetical protein
MSEVNWRRPLALAVVLIALASFSYWLAFKHTPEGEEQDEKNKKIVALNDAQIQSVRIGTGTQEFQFECADFASHMCKSGNAAKWEITTPLKTKADDSNTRSLVSTVSTLTAADTISLKDETAEKKKALLKDYGLDAPSLTKDRQIQINSDASTIVLYLGQTHPIGDGIFAAIERLPANAKPTGKIDDNQVYVIPSYFKGNFDHNLTYWRDKKILPIATHEIEGFTLKDSKTEIQAERKDGEWTVKGKPFSKNDVFPGDIENIDALLSGASALTARDFVSDSKNDAKAKTELKGAKPVITLSLKKEKVEQPVLVTLYEKSNGKPPAKGMVQNRLFVVVSDLDPLFEVDSYAKARFDKELKDLRLSKVITSMDRFQAKHLEFSSSELGPKPWALSMKDGKWTADGVAPADAQKDAVDSEKVQNFLDRLSSTKIDQFISQNLPIQSSGLQFTLGDDTHPQKRKILFWRVVEKNGQKLYAKDLTSPRNEVFLMDNALSDAIPWEKAKFKK